MSKTEGLVVLDSVNAAKTGVLNKNPDIAEKAARPHAQNVVRRKLADISNLPQNQRLLIQGEKAQCIETTTKEYIDQLQKENMALVKMLAQRNKIIEQSGIELDRLRVNLLKMQEQNQQLALSNTQMLVELNSGKDRLKVLQHELGCKSGLLKARKLGAEEKGRTGPLEGADAEEEVQSRKEGGDDEKPHKTRRSLQPNSVGSSEQVQSKETIEKKRPSVRRQSARFKAAEVKPVEDLFDARDTSILACSQLDEAVAEKGSTSENPSVKVEDNEGSSGHRHESQESGRPSLRSSRLAAKKVQSYKEKPINIKMRRTE
ncbi:SHUGOSHIN 1 isoform X2 [Sesamum indicum]|uniref:SHUGOSHIN 1 isoform X2 n=1 Tax=Sesamum indicum TaxID=4182 RepID=A0A6I9U5M3_SESIN|nr:SHUGOSHIN 1 isoform X2 [Sesamum indicum]